MTDTAEELIALYDFAADNISVLDDNDAFTADIRNELKNALTTLAVYNDALEDYFENELTELNKAVKKFAEENADIIPTEEPEEEEPTITETVFNKYAVSNNSVVYEKFDNGTTLILNFNNYAIKVYINGSYYTVSAYGYIVIA